MNITGDSELSFGMCFFTVRHMSNEGSIGDNMRSSLRTSRTVDARYYTLSLPLTIILPLIEVVF